jgi:protein TonB
MTTAALAAPVGLRELALFGALSLAVHVGLFLQIAPGGGAEGAGMGGASAVTVEAADGTLAALVAEWDSAPEAAVAPAEPTTPHVSDAAPLLPTTSEATVPTAAPALPAPDLPSAAPRLATAAPPPPEPTPATAPDVLEATDLAAAPPDMRPTPRPSQQPVADPAPQAKNTAPAAPAAQHRAAGSGEGTTAGRDATGSGQSLSPERQAALVGAWSSAIQSRIARHQRYPSGNHGEGKVKVQMVIYRSGQLGDVTLAASSGRPALDAAALDAVRQAAPFPPAPDGLSDDWYRVAQWMSFRRR